MAEKDKCSMFLEMMGIFAVVICILFLGLTVTAVWINNFDLLSLKEKVNDQKSSYQANQVYLNSLTDRMRTIESAWNKEHPDKQVGMGNLIYLNQVR